MRSDRRADRRAMFLAIIEDPAASHSDRLKADDALRELERDERRVNATETLTPEQVAEELASLAAAVPGMLAVAGGPVRPPDEPDILRQQVRVLEEDRNAACAERDRIKAAARDAFAELFGEREPDAKLIRRVWRELREDPPDAEVVPPELPRGK